MLLFGHKPQKTTMNRPYTFQNEYVFKSYFAVNNIRGSSTIALPPAIRQIM